MARKKTEDAPPPKDNVVVSTAKAVGSAAGKLASLVGATVAPTPARPKIPKLAKKNKSRLPRREKKAAKKRNE